jgi:hypothetical protein
MPPRPSQIDPTPGAGGQNDEFCVGTSHSRPCWGQRFGGQAEKYLTEIVLKVAALRPVFTVAISDQSNCIRTAPRSDVRCLIRQVFAVWGRTAIRFEVR